MANRTDLETDKYWKREKSGRGLQTRRRRNERMIIKNLIRGLEIISEHDPKAEDVWINATLREIVTAFHEPSYANMDQQLRDEMQEMGWFKDFERWCFYV